MQTMMRSQKLQRCKTIYFFGIVKYNSTKPEMPTKQLRKLTNRRLNNLSRQKTPQVLKKFKSKNFKYRM